MDCVCRVIVLSVWFGCMDTVCCLFGVLFWFCLFWLFVDLILIFCLFVIVCVVLWLVFVCLVDFLFCFAGLVWIVYYLLF